ncbi:MAG: hypothetical protein IJX97_00540 [Clostridia bacterium]|nr:hypothetical protein [Clostridia bacterium]
MKNKKILKTVLCLSLTLSVLLSLVIIPASADDSGVINPGGYYFKEDLMTFNTPFTFSGGASFFYVKGAEHYNEVSFEIVDGVKRLRAYSVMLDSELILWNSLTGWNNPMYRIVHLYESVYETYNPEIFDLFALYTVPCDDLLINGVYSYNGQTIYGQSNQKYYYSFTSYDETFVGFEISVIAYNLWFLNFLRSDGSSLTVLTYNHSSLSLSYSENYKVVEFPVYDKLLSPEAYSLFTFLFSPYDPSTSTPDYASGYDAGYSAGHGDGFDEGYDSGFKEGFTEGDAEGYNKGYDSGYDVGYVDGGDNFLDDVTYDELYDKLTTTDQGYGNSLFKLATQEWLDSTRLRSYNPILFDSIISESEDEVVSDYFTNTPAATIYDLLTTTHQGTGNSLFKLATELWLDSVRLFNYNSDLYGIVANEGYSDGYSNGYNVGYTDAVNVSDSDLLADSLLTDIFTAPIEALDSIVLSEHVAYDGTTVTITLWSVFCTILVSLIVFWIIKLLTR